MTNREDIWLSLVDEPIAAIVTELEAENPELGKLLDSPEKLLAFRTFASIRVGIVLGRLLMESEVEPYDGSGTWVEGLLRSPEHREAIAAEVRAVAEELAKLEGESAEPDDDTRERFRAFAKRELEG